MTNLLTHNKRFIALCVILSIFCALFIALAINNDEANADEEENLTDEIVVAHITDTHYVHLNFCYIG